MRPRSVSRCLAAGVAALLLPATAQATSISLPNPTSERVLYGDFYTYSLPILAWQYSLQFGGGVGPGNPYYVDSTPGSIKDDVVIATGANGVPVNTNVAGMNDAYQTPNGNGGLPYFSTGQAGLHPTGSGGLTGAADQASTWNASLTALTGYLGSGAGNALNSLVFMFNNNEINSGNGLHQTLLVWAQMSLRDIDGNAPTQYFTFTNHCPAGNVCISGGLPGSSGGIYIGPDKDPALYSGSAPDNSYPAGAAGSQPALSDFVVSGGQVCFDGGRVLVACSSPSAVTTLNHNLGANQAAYAAYSPELDQALNSWWNGGAGGGSAYDVLSVDFRMGCNPAVTSCTNGEMIDNGYEQLFLARGLGSPRPAPLPGTLALLGIGMLSLTWLAWLRQRARL